MIQEIKMPSAGQTTDEAKIVAINVRIGDSVKRGDVLVEAETDKAILPVESFAAGQVLDILVSLGDSVDAGTVLAVVGKAGDSYQRKGSSKPAAAPIPAPAPVAPAATVYPAMPNAKMLAKERGIDLAEVTASNGVFIKRQDVLAFTPKAAAAPVVEVPTEADYDLLPMTRMRKAIAKRMQQSVNEIPAFQCTVSVDMRRCMALRETFKAKKGIKLSYNDILAKAIAKAAKKYTLINARYEGDEVRIYRHTNIGLAVGLEGALVVPVVKSVEEQGLEAVSAAYKVLVAKARENKLSPADMGCGSITISNLGMYDVDSFTAIVTPPESGILAVGSIKIQPQWDGKEFQPVPMMNITGAFDHRIIDGAYGAQFLQEVKLLMESPELMLG